VPPPDAQGAPPLAASRLAGPPDLVDRRQYPAGVAGHDDGRSVASGKSLAHVAKPFLVMAI
jgi:hypothetical protein